LTALLKKQRIEVATEGELVVFRIGNAEMKMDHATALQISTWMRIRGKEAQRNAGAVAHWSITGNLAAVEAGERPW
jgi:hypothetical protein